MPVLVVYFTVWLYKETGRERGVLFNLSTFWNFFFFPFKDGKNEKKRALHIVRTWNLKLVIKNEYKEFSCWHWDQNKFAVECLLTGILREFLL